MSRAFRIPSIVALPILALVLGGADCTDDEVDGINEPTADTTPQVDRVGALGNSLTAGLLNGGLVVGGQVAAFPNLVAQQAGWATMTQPLIADPGVGGTVIDGVPQSALFIDGTGAITTVGVNPLALLLNALQPVPYDNLAVPGATTSDLLNAVDAATSQAGNNLFFDLILRNSALPPGTWTAVDQMVARNPNALLVWIGSNEVLGGTLGGDPEVGVNVTPAAAFEMLARQLADRIENEMEATYVVVGGVPNVTDVPFVTTVPLGVQVDGVGLVQWQMEETDVQFVLLQAPVTDAAVAPTYLPAPFGTGENTLPSSQTLTTSEVQLVSGIVDDYNDALRTIVSEHGWGFVDVATELAALPADPTNPVNLGVPNRIFTVLPDPANPGQNFINRLSAFSLDGFHPAEIGQALTANAFIRALNDTYDLGIAEVDVASAANEVGLPPIGRRLDATSTSVLFDANGRRSLEAWIDMLAPGAQHAP